MRDLIAAVRPDTLVLELCPQRSAIIADALRMPLEEDDEDEHPDERNKKMTEEEQGEVVEELKNEGVLAEMSKTGEEDRVHREENRGKETGREVKMAGSSDENKDDNRHDGKIENVSKKMKNGQNKNQEDDEKKDENGEKKEKGNDQKKSEMLEDDTKLDEVDRKVNQRDGDDKDNAANDSDSESGEPVVVTKRKWNVKKPLVKKITWSETIERAKARTFSSFVSLFCQLFRWPLCGVARALLLGHLACALH